MSVEVDHKVLVGDKISPGHKPDTATHMHWLKTIFWNARRLFRLYLLKSITRRIVFLNLAALIILLSGILYLNQFRAGLTDARVESLLIQGQIIASAIAASATVETDAITIDPEKLLELQAGEDLFLQDDGLSNLDFPIDPEQIAPVLRQLISPTRTRARIYDPDGLIILDSRRLYSSGQVLRYDLPPFSPESKGFFDRVDDFINGWLLRTDLPAYIEIPGANGTAYPIVVTALTGTPARVVQVSKSGRLIVSVAVPVQRFRAVLGVLLLSTKGDDIDKIVRAERLAIVRVTIVAALVTMLLSIILAGTIARPLRRLSAAAERVRLMGKTRQEIPDFSDRHDEIGNLSVALRDMTSSLYSRIEAIESFAADVSHELKNPLTSLRSAVETLPIAKTDKQRKKLMDVIQHDVRRLDRLITDISNASRLDAELARDDVAEVDLAVLLQAIEKQRNKLSKKSDKYQIRFKVHDIAERQGMIGNRTIPVPGRKPRNNKTGSRQNSASGIFVVTGVTGRFDQVINNLLDNALSFIPAEGGEINVDLKRAGRWVELTVEDNGPGIHENEFERIFERFYTDRSSQEEFGNNSGLGLSISKQIIEAHGGTITASNVVRQDGSTGALFLVRLPAEVL